MRGIGRHLGGLYETGLWVGEMGRRLGCGI